MQVKVNYEDKTEQIEVKRKHGQAGGRIGGKARVPKGFAMMDKERLRKISIAAINKRWGKDV